MANLRQTYQESKAAFSKEIGVSNINATPKLMKIVVNVGWGDLKGNDSLQKTVVDNLQLVTGQKPAVTRAKTSIAGFKLREGDISGYRVTLRGKRMYDFLDRLVTYAFPRVRDFQGMPLGGFDKHGNYSFGFRDYSVFPEVPYETASRSGGMQITVVTNTQDDEQAKALLVHLGFPFAKTEK